MGDPKSLIYSTRVNGHPPTPSNPFILLVDWRDMSLKCHNGSKLINKNQLFTIHSGEKNIDKPHFLLVES